MRFGLKDFKKMKVLRKKVKDMIIKGKNIYKNHKGFEEKINYEVYDLLSKKTGLRKLVVSMTVLYPGKVNKEFKMTTGHSHKQEEVYFFLEGKGLMALNKKRLRVKKNDLITVPGKTWHRVINTGKKKLVFLSIFEKYRGRGK
jgi:glucose-6-phosphate isomerase